MSYRYALPFFLTLLILLPVAAMAKGAAYTVSFTGVTNTELKKALNDSSDAVALIKNPPATPALLNLRARADARRFRQLLDSRGYYASRVKTDVDDKATPAKVTFTIELGRPFLFATTTITNTQPSAAITFPTAEKLGLKPGNTAEAKAVVSAQEKLLRSINEQGYPFAEVQNPKVVVDHNTYTMLVTFTVNPGPIAYFGNTAITGLTQVKQQFATRKIPWKKGELYTPVLMERYEKALNESGLFAVARVSKAEKTEANGQLPITITLKERLHRTVKAGVNYQTDEGPGIKLLWQHRNFFNQGEQVDISGSASAVKRTINNSFLRNDFLRKDQSLRLFTTLDNEDTEAYFSNNASIGTAVERKITKPLALGIGVNYKLSHIKQITESGNYGLVSLPVYANYESRDNILDPTTGHNSTLQFTPSINMLGGNENFTKEYASTTHYFSFNAVPRLVLANRAAIGLIQSPSTHNIPPNERLYAGGSGSVRGYGYQSLGPTTDGIPTGGRSLAEISGEARYKFSPKFGGVAFIDGGNSFDNPLPDIQEGLYFGAGLGIRYYTEIAPVRFDVAIPLDKNQSDEQPVQFYISLGQAF